MGLNKVVKQMMVVEMSIAIMDCITGDDRHKAWWNDKRAAQYEGRAGLYVEVATCASYAVKAEEEMDSMFHLYELSEAIADYVYKHDEFPDLIGVRVILYTIMEQR